MMQEHGIPERGAERGDTSRPFRLPSVLPITLLTDLPKKTAVPQSSCLEMWTLPATGGEWPALLQLAPRRMCGSLSAVPAAVVPPAHTHQRNTFCARNGAGCSPHRSLPHGCAQLHMVNYPTSVVHMKQTVLGGNPQFLFIPFFPFFK